MIQSRFRNNRNVNDFFAETATLTWNRLREEFRVQLLLCATGNYEKVVCYSLSRYRFLQTRRQPVASPYNANFCTDMQYMLNQGNGTRV